MTKVVNLSTDYNRIIDIRKCDNISSYHLTIKDQMLSAKNPDELQNKFQWVMTRNDLLILRDAIYNALSE